MPNSISGTMLYDWYGNKITNYSVIQPEIIIISQSDDGPVETPSPEEPGYIEIKLDKTSAKAGKL